MNNTNSLAEFNSVSPYNTTIIPETIDLINGKNSDLIKYVLFKQTHVLIIDSKGALFVKIFINDENEEEMSLLRQKSIDDAYADNPIYLITFDKTGNEIPKPVKISDLALKGYNNLRGAFLLNENEKIAASSMKRWEGICFKPGEETEKKYNLFKGFPIIPAQGSIKPFLSFLEKAVGKDEANIILDFFAHLYQRPQEKPRFALVFKGSKGVGKNTVEQMLGKGLLRRTNYYSASNKEQFFGKFNAHMEQNLLSIIQELTWDKKDHDKNDGLLKDMITERTRAVEKKYVDQQMLDNYSRFIITTNATWAVPAKGKDERRYCVISFPEEKPKEFQDSYFENLYKWYDNGGKEALMYEMFNRNITNFSIDKAPYTKGLEEQLQYSLDDIEKFCMEALQIGYFGKRYLQTSINGSFAYFQLNNKDRIKRSNLYECFKFNYKNSMLSNTEFHRRMSELIGTTLKAQSDANYVQFLSLEESIKYFTKATGISVEPEYKYWNKENLKMNTLK